MTAVSDLLDGLEAAAKAATPGPWGYCNEIIGTDVRDLGPGSMSYKHLVCYIRDDDRGCEDEPVEAEADAACIVAEHNAAPVLVAALRAVLEIHRAVDAVQYLGSRQIPCSVCVGCGTDDGNWQTWPCPTVRALNAAVQPIAAEEATR